MGLVALTLFPGLLGSLIIPAPPVHDRFVGVYGNPTWTGLFLAVSLLFFVFLAVAVPPASHRAGSVMLASVAGWLLLTTRTRASIAAGVLAVGIMLLLASCGNEFAMRDRARKLIGFGGAGLAAVGLAVMLGFLSLPLQATKNVLRLEGGTEALYLSRGELWRAGWVELLHSGLMGDGFLSKYGDTSNTITLAGFDFPQYDWTTSEDPLNSLFLITKQIGLPGAVAFLGLIYALGRASFSSEPGVRPLAGGFFCIGLITAFLNGNWLLSFGDSFDRFSYVFLACVLTPIAETYKGPPAAVSRAMPPSQEPSRRRVPGTGPPATEDVSALPRPSKALRDRGRPWPKAGRPPAGAPPPAPV